jgi:HSP20 family protein
MTSLIRWNPVREMMNLRNEMDRLFERAMGTSNAEWQGPTTWGLALDVVENDDAFTVVASVPGINPDDLDITVSNNMLTIKGEFKADESIDEEKYHFRERSYGSFDRSITLPVSVVADAIEASYENGVLTLTVPKSEEVKPRRIAIKANANGH